MTCFINICHQISFMTDVIAILLPRQIKPCVPNTQTSQMEGDCGGEEYWVNEVFPPNPCEIIPSKTPETLPAERDIQYIQGSFWLSRQ
jgi:hypothetical protein